jgi:transmembrane secretion effector/LysR substrate binding domain-containing protein
MSCPTGLFQFVLAKILPKFLARYPKTRLQVLATNRAIDLVEDNVDIAIRARVRFADEATTMRMLCKSELIFVASSAFAEARQIPASADGISSLPFLSFLEDVRRPTWTLIGPNGATKTLSFDPVLTSGDFNLLLNVAAAGLGVALLPSDVVRSHSPALRATLIRAAGFFLFASTYWALLPLLARTQIASGPGLYGILLGAIGAGAVCGAFFMPWLRAKVGPDLLVASGMLGTAATLALYGLAHDASTALVASLLAGVSWIAVLATLAVSAQVSLWGKVAAVLGLPAAHFLAAVGVLAAIPLTWHWKLQAGAGVDLTPSMHWPAPLTAHPIDDDRGPVLVTVEYRISPQDRQQFLQTIEQLGYERRRDGAYRWGVLEDAIGEGRIVEAFLVASWTEHLRQHERVTNADRLVQECVHRFHLDGAPKVTHFIAASA